MLRTAGTEKLTHAFFPFEFESRRADRCSFTDVVDGYFEERSAPFKVLPKYVHDPEGFGDCPSFCFSDF